MKCNLDDSDRELLCKDVTRKEVFDTIQTFNKNRTPGIDGLPIEFYIENWNVIADDFIELVEYILGCKNKYSLI